MSEAIPSYLKIRQYVFGCVANAKIVGGSFKIHTEEELCKVYGVCRTTVRKALDQMVEEGLIVRKPRLGTFIRPEIVKSYSMCYGKKLAIGLIYGDGMATFLDEYFMIQTVKMYESLMVADCLVRPMYFNGNSEQEAELLSKSKLDGVIWQLPMRKHMPVLRMFKACNVPVISTFPLFISDEFDCIVLDYYKCGYAVAKYLLGCGHRNILYINKNPADVEAVKKAGCMAAFAELGVEWQERLWHCDPNGFPEAKVKSIIKNSGNFSAVNCHTLHINCVKHELADRQDVQIIHNIHCKADVVREGIPGILIPAAQAGAMAVEMLLEMITHPEASGKQRQALLESRIIEPENTSTQKQEKECLK